MLRGEVTSLWSGETKTPGGEVEGGKAIQYFAPKMMAFQALFFGWLERGGFFLERSFA